jgi:hypothetical protein
LNPFAPGLPGKTPSFVKWQLALACALFAFLPEAICQNGNLNGENNSALDPKLTTVERKADKLYIHIKETDGSTIEIVKELEEVKPGTIFFHWTEDPDALNWMRSGKYPVANLDLLKRPTGKLQSFGPGFYVSQGSTDASEFGNILAELKIPARPRGLLGSLSGKPQESFWVLKEELDFPGQTLEEKAQAAKNTYPLLLNQGVAGSRVTGDWYTFFDIDALTGFQSVNPEDFLKAADEHPNGLSRAIKNLKSYPQNAKTLVAVTEEAIKRTKALGALGDTLQTMALAREINSPELNSALETKILELLPGMQKDVSGDTIGTVVQWVAEQGDADLFTKVLDRYLSVKDHPWKYQSLHSVLSTLATSKREQDAAIQKIVLDRLNSAIAAAKEEEDLHSLIFISADIPLDDLRDAFAARLSVLAKEGNLKFDLLDWMRIVSVSKHPDPEVLARIGKEFETNTAIDWSRGFLEDAAVAILKTDAGNAIRPSIVKSLINAMNATTDNQWLYIYAASVDDPDVHAALLEKIYAYARNATEKKPDDLVNALGYLFQIEHPKPEEFKNVLAILYANGASGDSRLAKELFQNLATYSDPLDDAGMAQVARAYLAKVQAEMPQGKTVFDTAYRDSAKTLLYIFKMEHPQDLLPYAKEMDFTPPPDACVAAFRKVGN